MTPPRDLPPTGVLERGLLLLSLFTQQTPVLQLKDLSAASGLDKATILRALKTLVAWGYLEKRPDGSYSPGPANLRMAAIYRQTSNFVRRIEGAIVSISDAIGQTTSFFVRSNGERVCLARDNVHRDFRYFIEVGATVPLADGGAAARLLLAYTDPDSPAHAKIRSEARYISRGERNRHLASVAVPVFEGDGTFLGTLTITGMAADLDDETLLRFSRIAADELARVGLSVAASR
ncbi:IclR family transcriptional regulator [Jiella sonneratiae]|uniref:Helix-turn-helix domain-containing protein n=1 Tax=Jiella sonneratiae TaxID=2816856 RepID=A0ABS3JAM3_9HYPH|nr:helix-turn-helix domain-containing protein [Jiella sonneratiae]MBO0906190.1 helix-turn-helix domain-containing protein [Jiella sonneratiae]